MRSLRSLVPRPRAADFAHPVPTQLHARRLVGPSSTARPEPGATIGSPTRRVTRVPPHRRCTGRGAPVAPTGDAPGLYPTADRGRRRSVPDVLEEPLRRDRPTPTRSDRMAIDRL